MRALVVLAILLISGCASPLPAETTSEDQVPTITDPRDNDAAVTAGSHAHDYWNGQDQKTLLRQSRDIGGTISCTCPDGMPFLVFRPDAGDIVPHGTGRVELRFAFDPGESTYREVNVWVKTAQDRDLRKLGALPDDGVFVFDIVHEDADPAHQQLSLWRIGLGVSGNSPEGATVTGASAELEAILHKTLDIPVLPPHPDLWLGHDELVLWDSTRTVRDVATDVNGYETILCLEGCLYHERLPDGVVVPFDATRLTVTFRSTIAPSIGVHYHPADSWEYEASECTSGVDETVCEIDVDFSRADSPYAKQSAWEFQLVNSQPTPVKAYADDVQVTYTAHRDL